MKSKYMTSSSSGGLGRSDWPQFSSDLSNFEVSTGSYGFASLTTSWTWNKPQPIVFRWVVQP